MTIKPGDKPENNQLLSRKVAVMCTLVVSVFIVAWTPMQIDILYLSFGSNKNQAVSLLTPLFALANLNSCIDPIIYGFMWKPMKDALTKVDWFEQLSRDNHPCDED